MLQLFGAVLQLHSIPRHDAWHVFHKHGSCCCMPLQAFEAAQGRKHNTSLINWVSGAAGPCRLTLEMVSEQVDSAPASSLYPYNALRNHALLLVKTEVRPSAHVGTHSSSSLGQEKSIHKATISPPALCCHAHPVSTPLCYYAIPLMLSLLQLAPSMHSSPASAKPAFTSQDEAPSATQI